MDQRKRAFGYLRVSTYLQAEYGLSLEAQEAQVTDYARFHGFELVRFFSDHDSGRSTTGRPEYQKMMAEVDNRKAQFIIATALDRFSRSQKDFLVFQEKYINTGRVHLVLINLSINTAVPASRQMLPFVVAFAQLESERQSERVTSTIRYIRSQGGHFGKVPFGYKTVRDGRINRLVKHPENYPWVEQMKRWYRFGFSFAEIAKMLNAYSVKPCQSLAWTKTCVYDLLVKERIHIVRPDQGDHFYDKDRAYSLAHKLRLDGLTYIAIADKLNAEKLRPRKASKYRWWSVMELLRSAVYHDRSTAAGCAQYWKAQGHSLRSIALKLMASGHRPKRGGQWYAQQVKQLLLN